MAHVVPAHVFPSKKNYFMYCRNDSLLNTHLNTLFTLISCTGKRRVFTSLITGENVYFLQKWAWNVLVLKKNPHKIKDHRMYLYVFLLYN